MEDNKNNLIDNEINSFFNDNTINDKKTNIIIKIDLGTCNSCCSIWTGDKYEIIIDEYNNKTIPSLISFDEKDNIYIGNYTKQNKNPINFFYESKRLIGRNFSDEIVNIEKDYLTYKINSDKNNNICFVKHNGEQLTPEFISSCILSSIKHNAENYLKQDITEAVITVPAYFNDKQRQATKDAALIAGLECKMILCEPIAAALAYGLNHLNKNNYKILVYDLGGGTLDVSIIELNSGIFEVIGTNGNMHLGGIDFDNIIYDYCLKIFKKNNSEFDNIIDNNNKILLKQLSENAKIILSKRETYCIKIDNFWKNINLNIVLTKNKLNELCSQISKICIRPIKLLLENINVNNEDINEIILVGGMTKMPLIKESISNYFNNKIVINSSINPDEIVAIGAGIQGYIINNPNTSFSESITLLNTTALSLCVELSNGILDILIPKNSFIPIKEQKLYTNADNSPNINIKLYEGERKLAIDNYLVGEFVIDLEPKPRGYYKIEVTIYIDFNNIIHINAKNMNNDNCFEEKSIEISGRNGKLSKEDIEKIILDSTKYKLIDKQNKKYKKLNYDLTHLINNLKILLKQKSINLNNINIDNLLEKINIAEKLLEKNNIEKFSEIQNLYNDLKDNFYIFIIDSDEMKNFNITNINTNELGTSIYQDDNVNKISNLNNIDNDENIKSNIDMEFVNTYTIKWFNITESLNDDKNKFIELLNNSNNSNEINKYIYDIFQLIENTINIIDEILLELQLDNNITIDKCETFDKIINNSYILYQEHESNNLNNNDQLLLMCMTIKKSILSNNDINENEQCKELIKIINSAEKYLSNPENDDDLIIENYIIDINNLCDLISF